MSVKTMVLSVKSTIKQRWVSVVFLGILVTVFALASCVFAADNPSDLERKIKQQQEEYDKIQRQISQTKKKIQDTKQKEQAVTRQIEDLSQKITLTQQKVNIVNLKINRLSNNIVTLTSDITKTDRGIKYTQDLLRQRFISMYKYGGIAEFNLLMSSRGAEEAMSNSYLLKKIAKQDEFLINDLTVQKKRLSDTKQRLQSEQRDFEVQGQELRAKRTELKSASNERNALLDKVKRDKALYMAQQDAFLKASKELESTINRLIAEKKRLQEERRLADGKKPVIYYKGGRLQWPTVGNVTSPFGTRTHPVFKTKIVHTGIDIAAPKGTPVTAADAGEVLYTGWMRGYGQVIIIDHGGNLTTVYAHLSQIECKEDAAVARGTVIGRVGSTGITTGNHLHFEVRVNGAAVDPMRYLQ